MRLGCCSAENLLSFPCDVEGSGLGVHYYARGSQKPTERILQKLQEQNQRVKSAALQCSVEYIARAVLRNIHRAAPGRSVASHP